MKTKLISGLALLAWSGSAARAGVVGDFTAGGFTSGTFIGSFGQDAIGRSSDGTLELGLITGAAVDGAPIFVGAPYTFTFAKGSPIVGVKVTATDADGDALTYSLSGGALPAGITFNADGTFSGTPTATSSPITRTVTVSDGTGQSATALVTLSVSEGQGAIISEFRFHGTTPSDEYIEIYNTLAAPLDIGGWFIRTNTGSAQSPTYQTATVPQNTVIPARGHFLFTGTGYTLSAYSNFGSNSTGNPAQTPVSIGADAADDSGVALYNASGVQQDAVGFASSVTTPISLREDGFLLAAPTANGQYAFMRDFAGSGLKDTGNSTSDFVLVSSNGASVPSNAGPIPAQLGAPNPESLSSPVNVNSQVVITLLQPEAGLNNAPNRLRTGSGNGGTLLLRRTIRNTGSQPLSRVRLLMTRITSQGSPTGIVPGTQADVRLISSGNESIALPNRDTNGVIIPAGQDGAGTTLTPVYAALLEAPSNATSTSGTPVVTGGGGGLGSSVVFDLTFPTPLLPNTSANYGFNLQVATGGTYLVAFNVLGINQP